VAPGVIERVFVKDTRIMQVGEEVEISSIPSVLALDGEREVEVRRGHRASIHLSEEGPVVVDVKRTMNSAMKRRILVSPPDDEGTPEFMARVNK
jgi:hypothetical protein